MCKDDDAATAWWLWRLSKLSLINPKGKEL